MTEFFSSDNLMALLTFDNLIALVTLTALEIVLGIDNIVFIAILTGKLDESKQASARRIGLALAMIMRILLLLTLTWIMGLTQTLFTVLGAEISGRDLILLLGGLFLVAKATFELHERVEGTDHTGKSIRKVSYASILVQVVLLDIVFSLDSVITAVGMAQEVSIMILAVMIAVGAMMVFAGSVSGFITRHPTIKVLALSFLLLIGVMLIADGLGQHIPKGYIYFAMAFSLFVEVINIRVRGKAMTAEVAPEADKPSNLL